MKTVIFSTAIFLLNMSICLAQSATKKNELFTITTPKGFTVAKEASMGPATIKALASEARADGTRASMTITVIDFTNVPKEQIKDIPEDVSKAIDKFISQIKLRRTNWVQSEVKAIEINGLKFSYVDWSGEANGAKMNGQFFVARSGLKIIQISNQDLSAHAEGTSTVMFEAAKTFKLK